SPPTGRSCRATPVSSCSVPPAVAPGQGAVALSQTREGVGAGDGGTLPPSGPPHTWIRHTRIRHTRIRHGAGGRAARDATRADVPRDGRERELTQKTGRAPWLVRPRPLPGWRWSSPG